MDDLDARIDALYGGPPADFTATRDALAKEMRAAGRLDEAEAVRALRRPTKLAAELNRLARDHPARTRALVESQAALAAAQDRILAGTGDAAQLREAEAAEAAALDAFPGDGGLRAALRVAARSETGREDLLRGRLSNDPAPDSGDGAGLFALGPAPPRAAAPAGTAAPADRPPDELAEARRARAARANESTPEKEDEGARRAREEKVRAAIAALEEARSQEGEAAEARDAARRVADGAETRMGRLVAERDALRARLDEATAAVAAHKPVAREAAAALQKAETAVRAATRARDGAERAARRLTGEGSG
jgi:hypothetical protein